MAPPRRLLSAIALVALIGTGCSHAPAETGDDPNAAVGATPNPSELHELHELQERLPEYAECMRENGVEDFPDPGANGIVEYTGEPDPQEFTSASEKCDDLLPEVRSGNR